MRIDHVTFAGPDLRDLERRFAQVGMPADYGGAHSNGVTHMSLIGFRDGSYLELISTLDPGADSPWWHTAILAGAGPSGWALQVVDVPGEVRRLRGLGVPVRGPLRMGRVNPKGKRVAWELAFVGEGEPGSVLPFLIHDLTPRSCRVVPSAGVVDGPLAGVAAVVVAVRDLDASVDLFQRVHGCPAPRRGRWPALGAACARFEGTPCVLVAPVGADSALQRRLDAVGQSPCALLLGADDFEAAVARHRAGPARSWPGGRVAWLDEDVLGGRWIGIV